MFFPGENFTRITPEQAGIPSAAIERALEAIVRDRKEIHSMLILKGGAMAFEQYFAPYHADKAHVMYSCSKTFTSMLIGVAQGKGLLSIHDKVLSYFPDVKITSPSANLRAMTLRDLLIMGSGHGEDTFGNMLASDDWASVFLNQAVDHAPGEHFVYNTGATYMLSAVLTKITGRTALDLAREWIFDKIGIEPEKWTTCPKGISMGGIGLFVKPTDMARLGILISNEGRWNGEEIIPAEYIRQARAAQIDNSVSGNPNPNWTSGYGYQMWRCAFGNAFRADGLGGQFIVMIPERELIFVFTSALGSDIGYPLDIIRDILLPAIADEPLTGDPVALDSLREMCGSLSEYPPETAPQGEIPFGAFTLEENPLGISAIQIDSGHVRMTDARGRTFTGSYGWGRPLRGGDEAETYTQVSIEGSRICFALHIYGEPTTHRFTIIEANERFEADWRTTQRDGAFRLVGTRT